MARLALSNRKISLPLAQLELRTGLSCHQHWQGWKKCGLGDVLSAAQQREAMKFCMTVPEEVLGSEPEVEDGAGTDNEGEEEPDATVDYDAV
jgi:hypothetical protein